MPASGSQLGSASDGLRHSRVPAFYQAGEPRLKAVAHPVTRRFDRASGIFRNQVSVIALMVTQPLREQLLVTIPCREL